MRLQHLSIHGHKVAFRTAGEGPVVLLVHGMAGSSATWKHVLPTLAQRFTVVAPRDGTADPSPPTSGRGSPDSAT